MLPRVVIHCATSADGRLDWFTPDIGQFYGLVGRWKEDATLAGSHTVCQACESMPPEDDRAFEKPPVCKRDSRALLVVPDSGGRVRNWQGLRMAGFWRDVMALVSRSTPQSYLRFLEKRHVPYIVAGQKQVDLRAALQQLRDKHNVKVVRTDSGGTLNGVLLREGLVDEVSVLVYPALVGGSSPRSFYRAPDLQSPDGVLPLRLLSANRLKGGVVWMRYRVIRPKRSSR